MFELRIELPYLSANTPEELQRKIADIKRNVLERAMIPTAFVAFSNPETVQVVEIEPVQDDTEEVSYCSQCGEPKQPELPYCSAKCMEAAEEVVLTPDEARKLLSGEGELLQDKASFLQRAEEMKKLILEGKWKPEGMTDKEIENMAKDRQHRAILTPDEKVQMEIYEQRQRDETVVLAKRVDSWLDEVTCSKCGERICKGEDVYPGVVCKCCVVWTPQEIIDHAG